MINTEAAVMMGFLWPPGMNSSHRPANLSVAPGLQCLRGIAQTSRDGGGRGKRARL